jgi:hypothetical protein
MELSIRPFFLECVLSGWDEVAPTMRQHATSWRYEISRSAFLATMS